MEHFTTTIRYNNKVAEGYMHLRFFWPETTAAPVPGQFVTIRTGDSTDPLLRRPFAVSAFSSDECSVIYQIRGKATNAIAALHEGDEMSVLGPLGNSFPDPVEGKRALLIAGGVGFGPIYYLASKLARQSKDFVAIVGARTKSLIPDVDYGAEFRFCTDDGTQGYGGTVLDYAVSADDLDLSECEIFACGPDQMLAACARVSADNKLPCWVSMEQIMGCAVGACMGCAVEVHDSRRYVRVCTEGPVFNAEELVWK